MNELANGRWGWTLSTSGSFNRIPNTNPNRTLHSTVPVPQKSFRCSCLFYRETGPFFQSTSNKIWDGDKMLCKASLGPKPVLYELRHTPISPLTLSHIAAKKSN